MKLLTYSENGIEKVGVLTQDQAHVVSIEEAGLSYKTMNAFIQNITIEEKQVLENYIKENKGILKDAIQIQAPIPHPQQDIICLGINYMAHAVESARYKEEAFGGERPYAVYFSKRVNRAGADGSIIPAYENLVDSLDYEVELAVIIGKDAKNVRQEDAFEYVFGYTIINDVSARNLQTRHKQWYFGKSLDGFLPMGPYIVTEDCFTRPPVLSICSRVNGELRQNATTDLLIFGISHVISELSQGMTLKAGTIIAMGTPAGVGMGMQPPQFLKSGDEITCEIEGIGSLTNYVR
ncbi:MAG: fumarylacetoacetate hydrolase family protein [Cellulosilyticum sp.]|nr:fumarylacetoacetate hydrolase family protein [Cellulosilyticum sp.]